MGGDLFAAPKVASSHYSQVSWLERPCQKGDPTTASISSHFCPFPCGCIHHMVTGQLRLQADLQNKWMLSVLEQSLESTHSIRTQALRSFTSWAFSHSIKNRELETKKNLNFFTNLFWPKSLELEGMWWWRIEWKILSKQFPVCWWLLVNALTVWKLKPSMRSLGCLSAEVAFQKSALLTPSSPAPLSIWVSPQAQHARATILQPWWVSAFKNKHWPLLFLPGVLANSVALVMVWTPRKSPLLWHPCHFHLSLAPPEVLPARFAPSLFWKREISDTLQLAEGFGKVIVLEELQEKSPWE